MGKLLQFPLNRIVRNVPEAPELSEEEQIELKKDKFVEQLTDQLSMDILAVLQENVVNLKRDEFLRDLAVVIESIKSLLKRDFDRHHPMQNITDSFINIHTTKDGRKLTDINYSKILKTKRKDPPKKEEQSINFEPDFNLE
tara:strand:+ start:456 stop:878 length:423 start_codon:yes stop_codon:yes gene_type:complete